MKRLAFLLETAATLCMTIASLVVVWTVVWRAPATAAPAPGGAANPVEDVEVSQFKVTAPDLVRQNSATPRVAVVEFSDFQCPYCGRFARETLVALKREFIDTAKIAYVFKNYPLESIHPFAFKAAEAAACAGRQKKFWDMHEMLFSHQEALTVADLSVYAEGVHLKRDDFRACLDDKAVPQVRADMVEGNSVGVSGTPTLFVGTVGQDGVVALKRRIKGVQSYDVIKSAIDQVTETSNSQAGNIRY